MRLARGAAFYAFYTFYPFYPFYPFYNFHTPTPPCAKSQNLKKINISALFELQFG